MFRAGPASATGENAIVKPPPEAMPDAAKTNGSCSPAACHDGTAVLASSTAVYVVIGPPNTPAPTAASLRSRGNQPSRCSPAVPTVSALNGERMYDPTDSGEVGLNTRSMCRNRSGRPRSTMSSPTDPSAPTPAKICAALASVGRLVNSPSADRIDEDPAAPPRNRYSGTSGLFHTGG